jgi:hypothetical protein
MIHKTHGMTKTPLYRTWEHLFQRCYNRNNKRYKNYGGRGITVCKRWHRFENFHKDILERIGKKPSPKYSLDRKNNNQGYKPSNVRWATYAEQNRNHRGNRILTVKGKKMILTDVATMLRITPSTLRYRLERVESIDKAIAYYQNKKGASSVSSRSRTQRN